MDPLIRLVANALPGEKKLILFAGAGVSKDAGLPTAWDLMLKTASYLYASENKGNEENPDIQDWFINSKYAKMTYAKLISKLFPRPNDQRDFLKKHLNDKPIGDAHKLIAELVRRNIVRAIITTNFDNYIERALLEKGLTPQVLASDDDIRHAEPLIHCKSVRIYKPHGDLERGEIKNTPKDLEELNKAMAEELIHIMSDHCILIIGYAGEDAGILDILKKRNHNKYGLYWVDPKKPSGEANRILERFDCDYLPCEGAGQFFKDLLSMHDKIKNISPSVGTGLSISDLQSALKSGFEPVGPIYRDFLTNLSVEFSNNKPDFAKFTHADEAIVAQIEAGVSICERFL